MSSVRDLKIIARLIEKNPKKIKDFNLTQKELDLIATIRLLNFIKKG
jgi:aryl carrier-like protein